MWLRRQTVLSVAAVLAVSLAACGEDSRDRVDDYVKDANAVQKESTPEFKRANTAYVDFVKGKLPAASAALAFERSELTMKKARDKVAALKAPDEARRLQRRLLVLFDRNLALARETTKLAFYQQGSDTALKPLDRSSKKMAKTLGGASDAGAQAAAVSRYAKTLGVTVRRLEGLAPPPLLVPAQRDLIRRLDDTRRSAAQLAGALRDANAAAVAANVTKLRAATTRRPRRDLLARSVAAYNRRYRAVAKASAAVQREHQRLDRSLD